MFAVLLCLAGCSAPPRLDTDYGRRTGSSVNGTGVLANLFEQSGFRVAKWQRLSPRLEKYQVIVWAPDDFDPPNEKQRKFLERWLSNQSGRTLVYIGRDYDGATAYWRKIQPLAPPNQQAEIARKLAKADAEHTRDRLQTEKETYARWFTQHRDAPRLEPRSLDAPTDRRWTDGVDATKVEIEVSTRLDIPKLADRPKDNNDLLPKSEILLQANGCPLVTRVTDKSWGNSKIIVVANGSFLLNLGLVNHEHRKLAGKLIDECGPPSSVVFLESGRGGPNVLEQEASAPKTGFSVLTTWPIGMIVLHMLVFGMLLCFHLFPTLGRPREWKRRGLADFGKHIEALGKLLERTGRWEEAQKRWAYYVEHAKRDSGTSHIRKK